MFTWHDSLLPTGRRGMTKIRAPGWRDDSTGPMQVVSGAMGKERVHFETLAAKRMPREMQAFLSCFESKQQIDPVLKAGLTHLWFVTIHPFDDGNGASLAIANMALGRSENGPQRFYSMSVQIRQEREDHYDILETTQKETMDVTRCMEWFLACLGRTINGARARCATCPRKRGSGAASKTCR